MVIAILKSIWEARNVKIYNEKEKSKEMVFKGAQEKAYNWFISRDTKFCLDSSSWFSHPFDTIVAKNGLGGRLGARRKLRVDDFPSSAKLGGPGQHRSTTTIYHRIEEIISSLVASIFLDFIFVARCFHLRCFHCLTAAFKPAIVASASSIVVAASASVDPEMKLWVDLLNQVRKSLKSASKRDSYINDALDPGQELVIDRRFLQPFATKVWRWFADWSKQGQFCPSDFRSLMKKASAGSRNKKNTRNEVVFKHKKPNEMKAAEDIQLVSYNWIRHRNVYTNHPQFDLMNVYDSPYQIQNRNVFTSLSQATNKNPKTKIAMLWDTNADNQ
ncbi:hypothetical protein LXL04_020375 [Taraxacum kok-saghyz]